MITNQILTRQMGAYKVEQRTKDGMFNATSLLRQWNETMGTNKRMQDFFDNDSTKEFIKVLCEKENLQISDNAKKRDVKEITDNQLVIHRDKKRDVKFAIITSRARADRGGGTWVHPFLFIKFAMWISAEFEYNVVKFVYDRLLEYRDEAGEAYKELCTAVYQLVGKDKMRESVKDVGKALNFIVWNKHEEELRNKQANEKDLKELFELERKVASLVSEGFIRSFKDLMNYLRMLWRKKYEPKEFRKVA